MRGWENLRVTARDKDSVYHSQLPRDVAATPSPEAYVDAGQVPPTRRHFPLGWRVDLAEHARSRWLALRRSSFSRNTQRMLHSKVEVVARSCTRKCVCVCVSGRAESLFAMKLLENWSVYLNCLQGGKQFYFCPHWCDCFWVFSIFCSGDSDS